MAKRASLILVVLVLAGCGGTPKPAPSPRPTAPAPTATSLACPDDGVRLSSDTEADAAMGLRSLSITLTNCGTVPYVLNGYPAVQVLGKDKTPLIVTVGHGSQPIATVPSYAGPARRITVRPGEHASVGLLWRNLVTDSSVPQTVGAYLSITPKPGTKAQLVVPRSTLDLGNTARLGLSPWTTR